MNNTINFPAQAEVWKRVLREKDYRITSPRKAVIDTLANSSRALNAAEIFDLAKSNYPSLGLVSVYRTLETLEDLGLIQRVHQHEECHAYISAFKGHQHLLICTSCGKALFFEGEDLGELFERVSQESGYQIQDHWLQLFGLCNECKNT